MDSHSEADVLATVDTLAREVIAKHAPQVDAEGKFPQAAVDAIRDAGLMGLVSTPEQGRGAWACGRRSPRR